MLLRSLNIEPEMDEEFTLLAVATKEKRSNLMRAMLRKGLDESWEDIESHQKKNRNTPLRNSLRILAEKFVQKKLKSDPIVKRVMRRIVG